MTIQIPPVQTKNEIAALKGNKICDRCQQEKPFKQFNRAFGYCKQCITDADYDTIQPEISKILRGFSPLEKQNILRECFYRELDRIRKAKTPEGSYG